MNKLKGIVKEIKTCNEIAQISIEVNEKFTFTSMMIDANQFYLNIGDIVDILFKETEVLVATTSSKVSAKNAFISKVTHIDKGQILSQIFFDFDGFCVSSIISSSSVDSLVIEKDYEFLWFIKANEVTIQKRI